MRFKNLALCVLLFCGFGLHVAPVCIGGEGGDLPGAAGVDRKEPLKVVEEIETPYGSVSQLIFNKGTDELAVVPEAEHHVAIFDTRTGSRSSVMAIPDALYLGIYGADKPVSFLVAPSWRYRMPDFWHRAHKYPT